MTQVSGTMRKGITPVIAVVLLLLITVGAVGSAFGLYQSLTNQASDQTEQLSAAQRASQTEVDIIAMRETSAGFTNVTIENTGDRVINITEELRMFANVDGSGASPISVVSPANNCFDPGVLGTADAVQDGASQTQLRIGETISCNTTTYPDPGSTLEIQVNFRPTNVEKASALCDPQTAAETNCYP